ncbi:MAG: hypothetical protein S4CHLAM45_09770 [Chlamydiales bacterium]|nr:hypothetical protein [Chlamydiales bacterium]MCH9620205.1 hypothetical protein [Chlamydiales bacterium]MCH9623080.1 hypothetical protein [Chlamydiales bacterium]
MSSISANLPLHQLSLPQPVPLVEDFLGECRLEGDLLMKLDRGYQISINTLKEVLRAQIPISYSLFIRLVEGGSEIDPSIYPMLRYLSVNQEIDSIIEYLMDGKEIYPDRIEHALTLRCSFKTFKELCQLEGFPVSVDEQIKYAGCNSELDKLLAHLLRIRRGDISEETLVGFLFNLSQYFDPSAIFITLFKKLVDRVPEISSPEAINIALRKRVPNECIGYIEGRLPVKCPSYDLLLCLDEEDPSLPQDEFHPFIDYIFDSLGVIDEETLMEKLPEGEEATSEMIMMAISIGVSDRVIEFLIYDRNGLPGWDALDQLYHYGNRPGQEVIISELLYNPS